MAEFFEYSTPRQMLEKAKCELQRLTKNMESETAKYKRYRLTEKALYGGIEEVEAKRVLVCSTGAMEKNIDVVIGRRFKKHGMSWTTGG